MESGSESDLSEAALPNSVKVTSLNMLPETSRRKYETAYKLFMDWKERQENNSLDESVLMNYFGEMSHKFKSSTLWTQYSMLRSTLSISHNVDIAVYTRLRAFLKKMAKNYRPKKSKTFQSGEIRKFINEAPDRDYLLIKVALIMGVMGACRRHELHQMKVSNFHDLGSAVLVTVPDKVIRKFTITGHFYEIFKKYASLRPPNAFDPGFFLNYQKGKCTTQKVGINKFGDMGKQIAKYLKLPNPELYTGHCFRRSSATMFDHGAEEVHAWTSPSLAEGYLDYSILDQAPVSTKQLAWARMMEQYNSITANVFRAEKQIHEILKPNEPHTTDKEKEKPKEEIEIENITIKEEPTNDGDESADSNAKQNDSSFADFLESSNDTVSKTPTLTSETKKAEAATNKFFTRKMNDSNEIKDDDAFREQKKRILELEEQIKRKELETANVRYDHAKRVCELEMRIKEKELEAKVYELECNKQLFDLQLQNAKRC